MARDIVNESSTFTLQATFHGLDGEPDVPNTLRYLIKDVTNDRIVRNWTEITPLSTVELQIEADENDLYEDNTSVRFESRVVTFQANFDTDDQYADEYSYLIKNLSGFES